MSNQCLLCNYEARALIKRFEEKKSKEVCSCLSCRLSSREACFKAEPQQARVAINRKRQEVDREKRVKLSEVIP